MTSELSGPRRNAALVLAAVPLVRLTVCLDPRDRARGMRGPWHVGRIGIPLLTVTLVLLGGCDSGDTSSRAEDAGAVTASAPEPSATVSPPEINGHTARFLGAASTVYETSDGLTLEPPGADVEPEISWDDAFPACFEPPACVATGDGVVVLATVTGPDGELFKGDRMFERRLMYVVVWEASRCFRPDLGSACHVANLLTAEDGNLPAGTLVYATELPADQAPAWVDQYS